MQKLVLLLVAVLALVSHVTAMVRFSPTGRTLHVEEAT